MKSIRSASGMLASRPKALGHALALPAAWMAAVARRSAMDPNVGPLGV